MTMRLKVMMTGNPFLFGRAMVDYLPLPESSEKVVRNQALVEYDIIEASQRPNLVLDPCKSEGGELLLPMFTPSNFVSLTDGSLSDLGEITVRNINPLVHANASTDFVILKFYGTIEDLELYAPTSAQILNSEYSKGPVSQAATTVANLAGKAKSLPIIGDYAKATEQVSKGVADVATTMGFSKPRELRLVPMRNIAAYNTATGNGSSTANSLAVDQKNELTISPHVCGVAENTDELAISYIAGRESYLGQMQWFPNTAIGAKLGSIVVDPGLSRVNGSEYHFLACGFAAMPFSAWRGTMKYRFDVVCSKYHRGRIIISYDPAAQTLDTSVDQPTQQQFVVDISENTDFSITVGYSQSSGYRRVRTPTDLTAFSVGAGGTPWQVRDYDWGNGVLTLHVFTELTVPNSVTTDSVRINVYASACEDISFANPCAEYARYMPYLRATVTPEPTLLNEQVLNAATDNPVVDAHPPVAHHFGLPKGRPPGVGLIHYGEEIESFRTLLKRYHLHEVSRLCPEFTDDCVDPVSSTTTVYWRTRRAFPTWGGRVLASDADVPGNYSGAISSPFYHDAANNCEFVANTTLANWVVSGFAGWRGSNRWLVDSTYKGGSTTVTRLTSASMANGHAFIPVSPANGGASEAIALTYLLGTPFDKLSTLKLQDEDVGSGFTGTAAGLDWNGVSEFEVPYYSNYRFSPAKSIEVGSPSGVPMKTLYPNRNTGSWMWTRVNYNMNDTIASTVVSSYHSIGEDFQVYWYTGPPVMARYNFICLNSA
ncbi:hypothetical protein 2 [Beihai hermit crab virus 1]|uniref:hypothetical protein 2 n=1 Tax=Beihai hermit crab virus 1 TaxID=1922388 RepID=UPI00090BCAB0|nr:hypothetical protein 2 [Beihai hermit crab virus 1]APG76719.1 hypothetical protein 2 [Beihai hermit crab virus 1]APG76790.1 hypothetical protein 2 [Beihai hermit crab virus 1]APG76885.1 hypothetical protein 2 [Beihai hermit crab virus 1]APG76911.1 hypothetical protein 2 [Beihai hermit crab virus 1]APG78027.1 hypothetical protein 2 [Beihai hermit crab virus 1]